MVKKKKKNKSTPNSFFLFTHNKPTLSLSLPPYPPLYPHSVDFHNSGKADNVGDIGFGSPESFVSQWQKLTKVCGGIFLFEGRVILLSREREKMKKKLTQKN